MRTLKILSPSGEEFKIICTDNKIFLKSGNAMLKVALKMAMGKLQANVKVKQEGNIVMFEFPDIDANEETEIKNYNDMHDMFDKKMGFIVINGH